MKEEYFMQVMVYKDQECCDALEKIVEVIGEGTEYYVQDKLVARSACGGMLEYLKLSPQKDTDDLGMIATWYMFKITDFVYKQSKKSLHDLMTILDTKLKSEVKGLGIMLDFRTEFEHEEITGVKLAGLYHVTATDVPINFKIIVEELVE
jgi:hypothetical protein